MEKIEKETFWEGKDIDDVRSRSEYLKQVTDFARYVAEEHIKGSDGQMSLVLFAADRTVGDGKAATASIALGSHEAVVASLATLMSEEGPAEAFNEARSLVDDASYDEKTIRDTRRRVRRLWGFIALEVLWSGFIIGFALWGVGDWLTTVTNLLLMVFIISSTVTELSRQRLRLARMKLERRLNGQVQRIRALQGALSRMRQDLSRMFGEDDDDD